jgi:hypothetical protein
LERHNLKRQKLIRLLPVNRRARSEGTPEIEERVRDFCIKWNAIKVRIRDLRR